MAIHPLAAVDPKAEVHEDAQIGPFCYVGANVTVHANAELRNHATVYGRATVHSGAIIFPGAVVGSDPQDLKFRGEDSETIIGSGSRIHECVTISKGTAGGGMKTIIGNNCLVMAYAHIAHDCVLDDNIVLGNTTQLGGHVHIGRRAIVSGMTGVHHFVTIGELAFVAAMSGVRCDVPPFVMVEGYPAEPRNINLVGLRRDSWTDEDIQATREAFRMFYRDRNGSTLVEIVERVRAAPLGKRPPVVKMCEWMDEHLTQSIKGRILEAHR